MRKKIIICALSVLLLILSGVLAFYLHGQNRPIAGLSGDNRTLLRVWMLHSPGGAARWVETQLSAYERQHPGALIYLRQVSADELTAEENLLPDVVLYRPGDIPDPDGLSCRFRAMRRFSRGCCPAGGRWRIRFAGARGCWRWIRRMTRKLPLRPPR